jgi:hypothetical protein
MASKVSAKRFDYVDIARFYGIFLVYYGHVVERFMYLKIEAAALQYKYIYSFHSGFILFFIRNGNF